MRYRDLKQEVTELLRAPQWPEALAAIVRIKSRQVVNPLFSCFYHGEALVRWRAISAMGAVVSTLADENMESARVVMRRLMWNLNDESGGIGWGCPEAMGEIISRHSGLAREYGSILVSYADPMGNCLEHPGLQLGVLWALGRLGRVRPCYVERAVDFISPYLTSGDSHLRGTALWALMPFVAVSVSLRALIQTLLKDDASITIYENDALRSYNISQLAQAVLTL